MSSLINKVKAVANRIIGEEEDEVPEESKNNLPINFTYSELEKALDLDKLIALNTGLDSRGNEILEEKEIICIEESTKTDGIDIDPIEVECANISIPKAYQVIIDVIYALKHSNILINTPNTQEINNNNNSALFLQLGGEEAIDILPKYLNLREEKITQEEELTSMKTILQVLQNANDLREGHAHDVTQRNKELVNDLNIQITKLKEKCAQFEQKIEIKDMQNHELLKQNKAKCEKYEDIIKTLKENIEVLKQENKELKGNKDPILSESFDFSTDYPLRSNKSERSIKSGNNEKINIFPSYNPQLFTADIYSIFENEKVFCKISSYLTFSEIIGCSVLSQNVNRCVFENNIYWRDVGSRIMRIAKQKLHKMSQHIEGLLMEQKQNRFWMEQVQNDQELHKLVGKYVIGNKRIAVESIESLNKTRNFLIDGHYNILSERENKKNENTGLFSKSISGIKSLWGKGEEISGRITQGEGNEDLSEAQIIAWEKNANVDTIVDLLHAAAAKYSIDQVRMKLWLTDYEQIFAQCYLAFTKLLKEAKKVERVKDFLSIKIDTLKETIIDYRDERETLIAQRDTNSNMKQLFAEKMKEFEVQNMQTTAQNIYLNKRLITVENELEANNLNSTRLIKEYEGKRKKLGKEVKHLKQIIETLEKSNEMFSDTFLDFKDYFVRTANHGQITFAQLSKQVQLE